MTQLATIWEQVQRVQQELKQGSRETQDTAIAALQETLDTCSSFFFPSFVYLLLTEVLHFYCQKILPYMGIPAEDQRIVREEFEGTITHLNTQEQTAKHLEAQLKQFFLQVKSGALDSIEDIVTVLCETLSSRRENSSPPLVGGVRGGGPSESADTNSPLEGGVGGCIPLLGGVRGGLQKQFRTFKKSPLTAAHVIPFFEALITQLPPEIKELFGYMRALFWHQLHEFVHMKVVLVNTKTKEALITRLDVTTSLESEGLDELVFESTVDDRMEHSCWNAVQAARTFLVDQFPDILKDKVLRITCRFPNPAAVYNDTSASLLVSLKVIGDVLDMEIDPQTVVSGEVDESGKVLPVTCVAEKVLAAQKHPDIHRVLLPAEGLFMTSRRVAITGVHDLSEAVAHYYEERFWKKLKQSRRKQELRRVMGVIAAPFAVSIVKDLFLTSPNPVTDRDLRLISDAKDLYQKEGKYRFAVDILDSLIMRFQRQDSATEALRLKAQALGYLGVICTQQHQLEKSLQALYRALRIWERLRDREQYVNTLFRIGSVYRYDVIVNGNVRQWRMALNVYQQAYHVLQPLMKQFPRLQGKYYGRLGYLYYWVGEYARAEQYSRQSVECFDEHDTSTFENYHQWNYQTAKQHLGRVFMKQGRYDQAYDILESTANAPILQTPHNQVRSLWTLSEFFFSQQNVEKGLEYAEKAEQLCQDFGLTSQQQIITNLLAKYNVLSQEKP